MDLYLGRLLDSLPCMVLCTTPDGEVEWINREWRDFAGLDDQATGSIDWSATISPDKLADWLARWGSIKDSDDNGEIETCLRRFDGRAKKYKIRLRPLRHSDGLVARWFAIATDIDDADGEQRTERRILDDLPAGIAILSSRGDVEAVNAHMVRYFDKTEQAIKDWDTSDIVHPDDLQRVIATVRRAVKVGQAYDSEHRLRGADGKFRWFQVRGNPLRNADGQVYQWYALHIDIDERKRAEEALRRSEVDLRRIINALPTTAWSTRPDGFVDFLSDRWLDYAGMSYEQAGGFGWGDVIHPDDAERLFTYWQGCLISGDPVDIEARMRRYDGVYRWFLFRANPLRDEAGGIVKWYGTNIDIEDRRRADEALRESERNSRLIVDTIPGMIALFSPDGELNGANHQLIEYFDRPLEEVKRWATNGMTHSDDIQDYVKAFTASIETGEPYALETRLLRHDGIYRWFQLRGLPLRDSNEETVRWYGLLTDIDDRKSAEGELRRSEAFLADAQRVSKTGSFAWRVGSNDVTWSDETYRIYGFDPAEPVTLDLIRNRLHPDNLVTFEKVIDAARREGSEFDHETRMLMPDQAVKYVRVVAHNERNKDGELELRGAVRDVTASRLAEEALSKARSDLARVARITSLGILTASIAHEVNQPLAGIVNNANTCLRLLDADPPNLDVAKETARRTIRDGNRAADVIARLRALFSKNPFAIQRVDLNEAVQEVIALSRGDIQRGNVSLHTELAGNLPPVAGDRVQLQQVIMNLMRNATEAMSGVSDRQRRLLISTQRDEDDRVLFSVCDAGTGFSAGDAERLFEAFYSTKSDGMGIGLSVSRSIIDAHKGRLWAKPNDGPGVTVSFTVPVYAGNEASAGGVACISINNAEDAARIS